jgi:hypothetical protein
MLLHTRENQTTWLNGSSAAANIKEKENSWTSLLKVKVPSKLMVFLQMMARQSLPIVDVLHHHKMALQYICMVCGEHDSWRHALVEDHQTRSVWELAPGEINDYVINLHEPHAQAWLTFGSKI